MNIGGGEDGCVYYVDASLIERALVEVQNIREDLIGALTTGTEMTDVSTSSIEQTATTLALLTAVPDANLDRPLDFARLSAGRASDPSAWPEPYRLEPGAVPVMVEPEPGHFVCAPQMARVVKDAA